MVTKTASQIHAQISAANETFMAHFNNKDAKALAQLYTEQAKLLPPNSDIIVGKEAIRNFWAALFEMGVSKANLEIVEVEQCGETAVEVSEFVMYGPGNQILDKGKYIVIWKNDEGNWRLHRDIFNSSMPALS